MAKFSLRRLLIQDFSSEDQGLIGKLAPIVNNAFEQVANAFSKSLSVRDNMAGDELDLEVTAPINTSNPIYFKNATKSQVRFIVCGQATTLRGTAPTGTPFFTFENSGTEVKVTGITNLTDGSKYILRIYYFT
jgi:hypothetical protein